MYNSEDLKEEEVVVKDKIFKLKKELKMTETTVKTLLSQKKQWNRSKRDLQMQFKDELKRKETHVKTLLSQKKQLGKKNHELRKLLSNAKKQMLENNTAFVVEKSKFKSKIVRLKKEINDMKTYVQEIMYDDDFIVDPVTGVIDMTQPKTPEKPKRKLTVSSGSWEKKQKK